MTELPNLREVFDRLRRGHHLSPEDEPMFSAVAARHDEYASWFRQLGITLVRHPRDFFYFEPDAGEGERETLSRIAVFSFILVDHAANEGRPIEEYIFGQHFLISRLPHLALDRYVGLLRQVDVEEVSGLRQVVRNLERFGFAKVLGEDEFQFLRPFHRLLDKCLELAAQASSPAAGAAKAGETAAERTLTPAP
jgi:chromosome condensin MukBEF MukE localization factor